MHRVLAGEQGAVRDIVLLNAAAGIVAFRLSQDAAEVQRPILERLAEAKDAAADGDRQRRGVGEARRLGRGHALVRR